MNLEQMAQWLEEVSTDPNAHVNGTAQQIEEQLADQGQQLFWDNELGTYYIGPQTDEE